MHTLAIVEIFPDGSVQIAIVNMNARVHDHVHQLDEIFDCKNEMRNNVKTSTFSGGDLNSEESTYMPNLPAQAR